MKLNEYKISDFPNFDLQSDSNNIRLDFPSLISDYIYDLEDGLNIKLHAEKEDEYGYLYDEFNLKDLQYYCDIKNLDYKFPKWIESLSIKVYQNNDELEKDTEMNGFVNIPVDDKSDITYNSDTQKINISNFTVYSWKNKEYTKKVISHELTHCYDFYKKFITGDSTFNLVDKDGNWKSVYDLEHEDNLFLYGVKADEFRDQIKELDPDNYSLYKNKALEILKDPSLWKTNNDLPVFCLVVCELFYYLDTSEMKAFYVSGKDVKEIYQDIYNICSKFPNISDKMLRKLSENSELSDMFRKFIFNVLGIKLKNNLSEYLKEIQFELVDDAHDAVMLFKQNLLNEALLQWNDSDIEDSGLIKASDVKKQMNYQFVYKINEPRKIKIFEGNNIYTYKDKVYVNGEHVKLDGKGYTVNEYEPGEYRVYIEDFDKIMDFTFYECTDLMSIIIPNSVTSIGRSAFSGCTGLTSVTIPNSVTSIGGSAFSGCSGLTSVAIPNLVTTIGSSAFSGCSGLTSVTIPNSVTAIGDWAFYCCSGLTSVTIGNSVTTIGSSAFYGCTGLTSVTIPNSVTYIGNHVFNGCLDLKKIYVESIDKFNKISFLYSKDKTELLEKVELVELKRGLNEALLQWDDSDTEDTGIIKASDVENKIKIPEEFIGRECPNNNGELYILIGDIRNTLGPGTKENPIDLNWIDLSMINQAEWTNNINGIFAGNANGTFEYIDISKWDVSGIKSIADLFYNNEYIKSVGNLSKWQTSNIENMHRAFCGCINLEYIGDLSNWKLDNIKDISQMFCHTHKLKWVGDLSSWTNTVESLPNQYKYGCIAYAGFNPDKFDWSWLFRKKPVVESLLIDWGNSNNQENTGILSKEDIRQAFKKMPILSWKTYDKNKEEVTKIVKHLIDLIIETGITKPMSVYRYTAQLYDTNLGAFQVANWRALSNIGYDTIQILEIFLEKNNLLPKEDIQKYVDLYKYRAVKETNIYLDPLEETYDFKPGSKEYYDTFMKIVNKFNHDPNILKYRQIAPEEHRAVADAWQMFTFIWNKPIGDSNEYFYFYLVMPLQEDTGIDPELTLILSGVPASELLIK